MKKNRVMAFLTAVVVAVASLPATALAAEADSLTVASENGGAQTYPADRDASGDGWSWAAVSRTFTLNDADIPGNVVLPSGTGVILRGDNEIAGILECDEFIISGPGDLAVARITERGSFGGFSAVFRGAGTVEASIYSGYSGENHIRIESGTLRLRSIEMGRYGRSANGPDGADELAITGGDVTVGMINIVRSDMLMTGGTVRVTGAENGSASVKLSGDHEDGAYVGGHFTFTGGTLEIESAVDDHDGPMALFCEMGFYVTDLGLPYYPGTEEVLAELEKIPSPIVLGDDVTVTGGKLHDLPVPDGHNGLGIAANEKYYAGYGFSRDGSAFEYFYDHPTSNTVRSLTLSAPDKEPPEGLYEPEISMYVDVPSGYWGLEGISFVTKKGIMNGLDGGRFGPESDMTLGMALTVMARLSGVDTSVTGSGDWSEPGFDWAERTGVHSGGSRDDFVSRQELIKMLWLLAGSPETDGTVLESFPDASSVSAGCRAAMAWAINTRITNGTSKGGGVILDPDGPTSRAMYAVFIMRAIDLF